MSNTHRFQLKPYTKAADRVTCPACGKKKCFSPYVDTETGEVFETAGRCDREVNCGYHYKPKEYFEDNPIERERILGTQEEGQGTKRAANGTAGPRNHVPPPPPPTSFIPDNVFNLSLSRFEENNFVKYLHTLFTEEQVSQAISNYQIGTSKHWAGSTVFWQISRTGEIRAGKIMLYNPETGKRVKEPFNHITWVHKALKIEDYNLKQAFFGEHLLSIDTASPVAIVESEKTAVIASLYLPEFIWLACGSLNNLSLSRSTALIGRTVTLFPDLNGYDKWRAKEEELATLCTISTSDTLEGIATPEERESGYDVADYLIRIDSRQISLREAFKAEFLQPEPLHDTAQLRIWRDYYSRGLKASEAKQVVNELVREHNFYIEQKPSQNVQANLGKAA